MSSILDAKYSPADLPKLVNDVETLTDKNDKKSLLDLPQKHEELFDGTLGLWQGKPHHTNLKDDAQPHHAKPHPVPKAHEQTLRSKVDRSCKTGVLRKINRSEWAFPSFAQPKKTKQFDF